MKHILKKKMKGLRYQKGENVKLQKCFFHKSQKLHAQNTATPRTVGYLEHSIAFH